MECEEHEREQACVQDGAIDSTERYGRSYLELAAHIVDDSLWICSSSVQLVDERYPRH